jgi:hypothetical protein
MSDESLHFFQASQLMALLPVDLQAMGMHARTQASKHARSRTLTHTHTQTHTHTHTHTECERERDRQRQTDRQKYIPTDRQPQTHTHAHIQRSKCAIDQSDEGPGSLYFIVVELVKEDNVTRQSDPILRKFRVPVNTSEYEEIMSCQKITDSIDCEDDRHTMWKFKGSSHSYS